MYSICSHGTFKESGGAYTMDSVLCYHLTLAYCISQGMRLTIRPIG